MGVRTSLEPREPRTAARIAALLTALGAGVALLFAVATPPAQGQGARLAVIGVPTALLGLSYVFLPARITWPVAVLSLPPLLRGAATLPLGLPPGDPDAPRAGIPLLPG